MYNLCAKRLLPVCGVKCKKDHYINTKWKCSMSVIKYKLRISFRLIPKGEMETLKILITVACLLDGMFLTNAQHRTSSSTPLFKISPAADGYDFTFTNKNGEVVLPGYLSEAPEYVTDDGSCTDISLTASTAFETLESCFDLQDAHWYGGAEQYTQYWPLETANFSEYSYVTKAQENQGIAEPYWLSSKGVYIHVQKEVPLFIDLNHERSNTLCLIAKSTAPYPTTLIPFLNYTVCALDDARKAHEHAIQTIFGKPSGYPDERMIRYPIWSTWAKYKAYVNESTVLEFADQILSYGFENSQLEVDDNWEVCYGALTFDKESFPNMKNLTDVLKAKGFRVTLWVHPFINLDCEPWHSEANEKGYFVKNLEGNVNSTWWNGDASAIDFTKPEAAEWYSSRLRAMQEENGIDSLKFDAGETSWLPQLPVLNAPLRENPSIYTNKYVNAASKFGPLVEVRVGQQSQDLPIFVRMLDKDSRWDFDNGIKSLVTTLLQMNMVGYPLVLPDMIGGNGYGQKPDKELFIRWLQANVFMPSLQYSYVPWDYDDETIDISKKYTDLHAQYSDKIIELAKKATQDGSPINPPIWWIAPTDETALETYSEFLLGEDILVAPILDEGARSRDIYLPKGEWQDELRSTKITGPTWLKDYVVELDELAYFTRISA